MENTNDFWKKTADYKTRRRFLKDGTLGIGGMALSVLLGGNRVLQGQDSADKSSNGKRSVDAVFESIWDDNVDAHGNPKWPGPWLSFEPAYSTSADNTLDTGQEDEEYYEITKARKDPISNNTVSPLIGDYMSFAEIVKPEQGDGSHRAYPTLHTDQQFGKERMENAVTYLRSYFRFCLPDGNRRSEGANWWFHFLSAGADWYSLYRFNLQLNNADWGWRLVDPGSGGEQVDNDGWKNRGGADVYQHVRRDGNGGVTTREGFWHFAEDEWHRLDCMFDYSGQSSGDGDTGVFYVWLDGDPWVRDQGHAPVTPGNRGNLLGTIHWGLYASGNLPGGTHFTDHEQVWITDEPVDHIAGGPPESPFDGSGHVTGSGLLRGGMDPEHQIINGGPGYKE